MRKTGCSGAQIASVLCSSKTGTPLKEVLREAGIYRPTF